MIAVNNRAPRAIAFMALLAGQMFGWQLAANAASTQIDPEQSKLTVRVYKSGLFAAFAHDHEIHAQVRDGSFDEQQQSVEFSVNARELRVIDPGVSDSERSEIQATMLSAKVLDVEKFPEIKFHSTKVERIATGKWTVQGDLSLHGQTHPVTVSVQGERGHYRGMVALKQTEFGITPIRIAGGSVKVKDEVRIEFDMVGKEPAIDRSEFGLPHLTCVQRLA